MTERLYSHRLQLAFAAAILVLISQIGGNAVPEAKAIIPIEDVVNGIQQVRTAANTLRALELHYEQIRYIGGLMNGNYIRSLTHDAVFGSGCDISDARWSRVANKMTSRLDQAYRLLAVRPDFTGCIQDWPKTMREQYKMTNSLGLAQVNSLEALNTIKQNTQAGEVMRKYLQGLNQNTGKTGRSWSALLQKNALAGLETSAQLVELQRANAAILEQMIIANQIEHDKLMISLNRESARRDNIAVAAQSLTTTKLQFALLDN